MAVSLQKTHGVWALVGPLVDVMVHDAVRTLSLQHHEQIPCHITLISKDELRGLSSECLEQFQRESLTLDTTRVFDAGVGGGKDGVFFIVIIWAAGQQLRKQIGLPPKHFHITLTPHDDHHMDKSIRSLSQPYPLTSEFLDHLSFTSFIFSHYDVARDSALELISTYSGSQKGFLRFADASLAMGRMKEAMLAYAQAYDRAADDKQQKYCIKKLLECSQGAEWGAVFREDEKSDIPSEHFFVPWSKNLRQALGELDLTPSLRLEPRDALFVPITSSRFFKLPRFFRWVIPYYLAVMSTPRREEDIDALLSPHLGIRHILTLTEESPLPPSWFNNKPISNTFLPIPNYHPPSIEQMDIVMRLMEDEEKLPILIHCGGGKGRAGTVLACYLAAYGFKMPNPCQTRPELAAADAIRILREIRPGSIETSQQEEFVSKWCSTIWKRQSIYPDRPSEPPPCALEMEGSIDTLTNFFVLVGLPGSGKSWFCQALLSRAPKSFRMISQDECGSRTVCESAISRTSGYDFTLLDRCNTSNEDRKLWLSLASNWAVSPVCIWFDYDRELCTSRAQMRTGHPTLPPGNRVRRAISQMQKQFVRPQRLEGFSAIVRIRSFQAALELVRLLLPPTTPIFKFPRTAHLIDIGGATPDDEISSWDFTVRREVRGRVIITEKIDGANMGFSLSGDRSNIVVQNRSHFVNSETHEQFKKLRKWVEQHRSELYHILDRDPYYAERYTLFGEWMYATHSIAYTRLPDLFIAFDLYDRSTCQFVDRHTLEATLRDTSIAIVPIMYELDKEMPSRSKLLELIESTSCFYDGRVEGVYAKVENHGIVQDRGKVVRGDFITGNEHWSKGNLELNGVVSPGSAA